MGCQQSTPVNEAAHSSAPMSAAPASAASAPKSTVKLAPASQAFSGGEPEKEAAPHSVANADAKFKISGASVTDAGVVYYIVESRDGTITAKRRFNEFKALYGALGADAGLPALPPAGLRTAFRGKTNPELISARELQFAAILNAIAANPALADSSAFQTFLTE
jgi:hypothetical protein